MKKIRWIHISLSSFLAAQVGCFVDESVPPPEVATHLAEREHTAPIDLKVHASELLKKIDLNALPKAVEGRARCACQQRTGH